jgi:SAM-dependent methyltransferase
MTDRPIALEQRTADAARLFSPSAARNASAIVDAFSRFLPEQGRAIEIGSGTGEHVVALAKARPGIVWRPSDPDEVSRASIAAWIAHESLANVLPPLPIDAAAPVWGVDADAPFEVLVSINMIHIAPWAAAEGVLDAAARLLKPGGVLIFYGPFKRGADTAPSNLAFDENLKSRNPEWGVRAIDEVVAAAQARGLSLEAIVDMPANNLTLAFRK